MTRRSRRRLVWATVLLPVAFAAAWWWWPRPVLTASEVLGPPLPHETPPAALATPITLTCHDEPLPDLIRRMAELAGAPIEVEPDSLSPADRVSLQFRGMPLRSALAMALSHAGDELRMVHRDGTIHVLRANTALATGVDHAYDLRRLIAAIARGWEPSTRNRVEELTAELKAKITGTPRGTLFCCDDSAGSAEARMFLLDLVRNAVEPDHWRAAGGLPLWMNETQGIVHIHAPAEVHAKVHDLLYRLWLALEHGGVGQQEPPQRTAARARLSSTQTMQPQTEPLGTLLDRLVTEAKLNLAINWTALSKAGVNDALPVTIKSQPQTTAAALADIVTNLGATDDLSICLDDDGVMIVTSLAVADRQGRIRFYPVGDLLAIDDVITPEEALFVSADLVRNSVDPDDWREAGGLVSSLTAIHNTLVIAAPLHVHDQIEALLHRHRTLRDR